MGQYVDEFRGTDMLVYADILTDNNEVGEGYTTGAVKILAPVAEISKTVESATDTKYYDNKPALVINGEGADTITLNIPALDLATYADLIGKGYDAATGAFLDGERKPRYKALGYRLKLTDSTHRYVWRYKGTFQPMDETSQTENAGTDSNGQTLTYTGIETKHVFTKPGKSQKALVVDERDNKANLSTFFDTVTTCDTLQALTPATLTLTVAANTTLTLQKVGDSEAEAYSAGSHSVTDFNVGDRVVVSATGGTIKIDNVAFTSGDTYTIAAATAAIVTTASA